MGIFIQTDYTDYLGNAFKIEIADATYTDGIITQVRGKAVLEYPKVKTTDILRGSQLKIELEADVNSTYYNRLIDTVGDKKLVVTFYKNNNVIWNGFIKPDGIVASFVTDYWIISVQAIDGLGLLQNISFLKSDGTAYIGRQSELELLARCLELTGQSMNFKVYWHNLYFATNDANPQITKKALLDTYVNTDRYVKNDKENTVFTAKDVIESILKKYGSYVVQYDNAWHIVRITDFYINANTVFDTDYENADYDLYDLTGSLVSSGSYSRQLNLGSDIDGYDPCHAGGNQQLNYKASLGAYKVYYEYGTVSSLLENKYVRFDDNVGTIDGWTVECDLADITFEAVDSYYIAEFESYYIPTTSSITNELALSYDYLTYDNDVIADNNLKIEILTESYFNTVSVTPAANQSQKCRIKLIGDSGVEYYLNSSGEWTLSDAKIIMFSNGFSANLQRKNNKLTITSNGIPEDGTITIDFYRPYHRMQGTLGHAVIKEVNIGGEIKDLKGESWTARRISNGTAVVDLEDKIFVGDNDSEIYIGGIEDSTGNNSRVWSKSAQGLVIFTDDQYRLLEWLVRDRLLISGGNSTVFRGGILGYLPYLGVVNINGINGAFMVTSYKWETANNKIEAEFERIFNTDIDSDINVDYRLEGDNIVRPAIE